MIKAKFIVVSDDVDTLKTIGSIIQNEFHNSEIFSAIDGSSGFELGMSEDPDLFIISFKEKRDSGLELCSLLKSEHQLRGIPVILFITNTTDYRVQARAFDFGVESILCEAPGKFQLLTQIRTLLKLKSFDRRLRENLLPFIKNRIALNEYEKYFWEMLYFGPALIWTSERDKKCDYFNQSWLNFTGRTLGEELGNGWRKGIHPDDLTRYTAIYSIAFDQHKMFSIEFRLRHKSGEYRWVVNEGSPLYNDRNEFQGFIGFCLDINKQKFAEESLTQNELKHQRIFENLDDVYYEVTKDGKVVEVSPSIENISKGQYKPFDIIGKSISSFYANIEDREALLSAIYKFGKVEDFELLIANPDGTTIQCDITAKLCFDNAKHPEKIVGRLHEVSEKIKARDELITNQTLFQHVAKCAGMQLWEVDANGMYTYISDKEETILGYKTEDVIGKKFFYDFFATEVKEELKKTAFEAFSGKLAFSNFENPNIDVYGNVVILETSGVPVLDNDNNLIGYRGADIDITSRKKSENDIEKTLSILAATLEATVDAILVVSNEGVVLNYNKKFTDIWQIPGNLLNRRFDSEFKSAVASKLKDPEEFFNNINKVSMGDVPSSFGVFELNDGRIFERYSQSLKIGTQNIGRVWSYRDITEKMLAEQTLRENEEKYHDLFENNPQPMWIYDLETLSFLEVNKAAIQHYGYSKEEFLSMTLKEIRPKEDIEALLEDVEMTRKTYNPAGEWRHLKKNGELIDVALVSHTITFNNRKARHVMVNDITGRKLNKS